MADLPMLHWDFEHTQSLTDLIEGEVFVLQDGETHFNSIGLDLGHFSEPYWLIGSAVMNNYLVSGGSYTFYFRFTTNEFGNAADSWIVTWGAQNPDMTVFTVRSTDLTGWVVQANTVVIINQAGPAIVTDGRETKVAWYQDASGYRLSMDGAYFEAEDSGAAPVDPNMRLLLNHSIQDANTGRHNGTLSELRIWDSRNGGTPDRDTWIDDLSNCRYPIPFKKKSYSFIPYGY